MAAAKAWRVGQAVASVAPRLPAAEKGSLSVSEGLSFCHTPGGGGRRRFARTARGPCRSPGSSVLRVAPGTEPRRVGPVAVVRGDGRPRSGGASGIVPRWTGPSGGRARGRRLLAGGPGSGVERPPRAIRAAGDRVPWLPSGGGGVEHPIYRPQGQCPRRRVRLTDRRCPLLG